MTSTISTSPKFGQCEISLTVVAVLGQFEFIKCRLRVCRKVVCALFVFALMCFVRLFVFIVCLSG